ncbi:lipase family protein [Thermoactinomyces daqus]|uniref:Lipase family protein n=1 Tax=Thermoactinomyces daqus TaxID=1329516 RepID=A0A7W1XBW6_9BACL|nr:lipase family protein [Thermoactinomyces daqus]MBA4543812.1 lipase family protein [Thermoactinomyces daqus]
MAAQLHETLLLMAGFCWQAREQFRKHQLPKLPIISGESFHFAKKVLTAPLKAPEAIGFIAHSQRRIVVVLRGSESSQDNLIDLQIAQKRFPFGPGKTHSGWTDLYQRSSHPQIPPLRRQIIGTVLKCLRKFPHITVYVTGHSMGGAIATMAALDLALNFSVKPVVITFGSPKTGDSVFVNAYNRAISRSLRVANEWDIVPKLLLSGYQHVNYLFPLHWNCRAFGRHHHQIAAYFVILRNFCPAFGKMLARGPNKGFSPVNPEITDPCLISRKGASY